MINIRRKSLVTGANRGLGHAFAAALLEAGARDPSTVSFTWRCARCT
jgi:NADP-dependent 3-hydroxy acid dehydrogenase YdfG